MHNVFILTANLWNILAEVKNVFIYTSWILKVYFGIYYCTDRVEELKREIKHIAAVETKKSWLLADSMGQAQVAMP